MNSTRIKFVVKAVAMAADQDLYFTPPHIGKLLSPIELVWSEVKYDYKRVPAIERLSDTMWVENLMKCLKKRTDFSRYVRKQPYAHRLGLERRGTMSTCPTNATPMEKRCPY